MKKDKSENPATYAHEPQETSSLHEPDIAYAVKQQGMYTIEDYYALPDERRAELINGVIYDMSAPTFSHQFIALSIGSQLLSFVSSKGGKCYPAASPVDVQLDCDDKTMLQPDVILVCDPDKIKKWGIYGAPDFVAEVLSPSTRKKDMIIKLYKYHNAGVREYWLIDPDKKELLVYDFAIEETPIRYTFEDTVPVAVLDNECMVDFKELYEEIRFLYESN